MKNKKFRYRKKKLFYIALLVIVLILVVVYLFLHDNNNRRSCKDYSYTHCPGECVVCPPCEVCSSVSCQTEESCRSLGFDRSWYAAIQERLNTTGGAS